MKAVWNGATIAHSEATIVVEGNHYFSVSDVDQRYLTASDKTTVCPWKGTASYYTVQVDGKSNPDAAWVYLTPKDAAKEIVGCIAFWKGVEVSA